MKGKRFIEDIVGGEAGVRLYPDAAIRYVAQEPVAQADIGPGGTPVDIWAARWKPQLLEFQKRTGHYPIDREKDYHVLQNGTSEEMLLLVEMACTPPYKDKPPFDTEHWWTYWAWRPMFFQVIGVFLWEGSFERRETPETDDSADASSSTKEAEPSETDSSLETVSPRT